MLITRARLLDDREVDIRLQASIIEIGPGLPSMPGEDVYDARSGTVLPGLHDHHVHLRAAAAALSSVRAGPPEVRSSAALRQRLHRAIPGDDGWIRAVGYHETVGGELNQALLDAVSPPGVPVRIQHRSGAMWALNSVALARIGAAGQPDGRFFRADPALPRSTAQPPLGELSRKLAALGVTGVTDATPGYRSEDIEKFSQARHSGELRQRLHCMAVAGTPGTDVVSVGPAKLILDDDSLDLGAVQAWVTDNHRHDHPVAIHAVTDSQLVVTIAALRAAGTHPGDRVEHAAVVPADCIADLRELGVTVVTQPNFVAERGDEYVADVPAEQRDQLWRVASLHDAGVPVALSTDTPFGAGDPWAAMRAAVSRRTPAGVILVAPERISAQAALTGFLGRADAPAVSRRIAVGEPGDLCVLSAAPQQVLAELDAGLVTATFVGGELVYG